MTDGPVERFLDALDGPGMQIADMKPGASAFTQLGSRVLAVLSRRDDGWCVYIDAVPGYDHRQEWQAVLRNGDKASEPIAKAIVTTLFYPGFVPGNFPYAL